MPIRKRKTYRFKRMEELKQMFEISYAIVVALVLIYWFSLRLLNPFIDAALAIIKCGMGVIIRLIFTLVSPQYYFCKKLYHSIHIPDLVKACFYLSLGLGIFIVDHFYATTIYDADQATFYQVFFQGKTYWMTELALGIGGFCIGLGSIYLVIEIFRGIDWLLNRPFQITVVVQR